MKTLNVELGRRSYPIHIGYDLLERSELYGPKLAGPESQLLVVTNDTVAPLYLGRLLGSLHERRTQHLILPDGESYKNIDAFNSIIETMLEGRYSRDCAIIALGGGVVGDLAGFAAACYQRGVTLIQIPTTLLAQVDSSVGGKTAVNHRLGKNMVGAFHQPSCVLADIGTLGTLPPRELRAGLAEVVKYALIDNAEFFTWLERHTPALLRGNLEKLAAVVYRCCETKARVVAEDERESGVRALLNLGHTFGHAIEAGLGYGVWLHGEAVAAGLCLAADLSQRLGWLAADERTRVDGLIKAIGLPCAVPAELSTERMLALMAVDKKVSQGQLRLVLLRAIGTATVTAQFDHGALVDTLDACRSAAVISDDPAPDMMARSES